MKLGPTPPALERLSELGVTTSVLAHRQHADQNFTISQYIHGATANRSWIRHHADGLVDLFNVVQQDRMLTDLINSSSSVPALEEHLAAIATRLVARIERASAPLFRSPEIGTALERLRATRHRVDGVPLVPAHTDPNPANILVTPERTYLVDWDGITLSDPMRDVGLMLWWVLPPHGWSLILRRFWLLDAGSAASIDRVYWWLAVNALRVALWIDQHTRDDNGVMSFLEDFREAEARRPNPGLHAS